MIAGRVRASQRGEWRSILMIFAATVRRHFLQRRIRPDARRVGLCCHGLHAEADHVPGASCGRLASSGWRWFCVAAEPTTRNTSAEAIVNRMRCTLYRVACCIPDARLHRIRHPNYRMSGDANAISFVQSHVV